MKLNEVVGKLLNGGFNKKINQVDDCVAISFVIPISQLQMNVHNLAIDLHDLVERKEKVRYTNFEEVKLDTEQKTTLLAYIDNL